MNFTKTKTKIQTSHSFSKHIDKDSFYLRKVAQIGSNSIPTCSAFDPLQGLLAIGFGDGAIKIFGKTMSEITLKCAICRTIKGLLWDNNHGRLAAFDDDCNLFIWNIKSHELCLENYIPLDQISNSRRLAAIKFTFQVTSLVSSQKVFYAGCINGEIFAVEWVSGKVSPSKIHNLVAPAISPVVDIVVHPFYETKLFIGYEIGIIVLYDLAESKVFRKYSVNAQLTSFSVDPSSKFIVSAYFDGQLVFWEIRNDKKPLNFRFLQPEPNSIEKVVFCKQEEKNLILMLGGNSSLEPPSLQLLKFDKDDFSTPNSQITLFHNEIVTSFDVFPSNPWNLTDPVGFIAFKNNDLTVQDFSLAPLAISFSLKMSFMDFKVKKFTEQCPPELISDLESCTNIEIEQEFIAGGFPLKGCIENCLLLASTAHQIYFFTNLPFKFKLIYILDLVKIDEDLKSFAIKDFEFDWGCRRLVIFSESSEIFGFEFSHDSGFEYQVVGIEENEESYKEAAPQVTETLELPPLVANEIAESEATESAAQSIKEEEEISSTLKNEQATANIESSPIPSIEVIDDHFESQSALSYNPLEETKTFGKWKLTIEKRSALLFPGFNPKYLIHKTPSLDLTYNFSLNGLVLEDLQVLYFLDLAMMSMETITEQQKFSLGKICFVEFVNSYILSADEFTSQIGVFGYSDGAVFVGYMSMNDSPMIKEAICVREPDDDPIIFIHVFEHTGNSASLAPSEKEQKWASRSSVDSEIREVSKSLKEEKQKDKKKRLSKMFSKKPEEDSKTVHERHYLLTCTNNLIEIRIDCSNRLAAFVQCPKMIKCEIVDSSFLACLTADLSIVTYSLPDLLFIQLLPIGAFSTLKNLKDVYLNKDGYILTKDSVNQISLMDILAAENRLVDSSMQKSLMFNNLVEFPAKPQKPNEGWFSSMFTKSVSVKNTEELFFGATPKESKKEEKTELIQKEAIEGQNVFRQTHAALQERGEKLKALDSKTSDLAENSKSFADLAKKIREKQEKKKWYQL